MSRLDRIELDRFLASLGRRLEGFEPEIPPPSVDPAARPILWVVGTPRSGTTLLAETIAAAADVGWVDNLAARFPRQPTVGMLLSETMRRHAGTVESEGPPGGARYEIGRTRGLHGTHEFGFFWSQWLGLEADGSHRLDAERRAAVDRAGLGDRLRAMIAVADRPFLVRNVICGLNAALLAEIHPRSLFIEMRRDRRDTAASILGCRRRHGGGAHRWWSLRPSSWPPARAGHAAPPETGDDPNPIAAAEVARQVLDLRADLRDEAARVAAGGSGARWCTLDYDELCRRPAAALDRLAADVGALGGRLDVDPARLAARTPRASPPAAPEELEAIDAVLSDADSGQPESSR